MNEKSTRELLDIATSALMMSGSNLHTPPPPATLYIQGADGRTYEVVDRSRPQPIDHRLTGIGQILHGLLAVQLAEATRHILQEEP